jgi:translation initiation factor IF-3
MHKEEALELAKELRMDLVVVDHNSTPPTCRVRPQQPRKGAKKAPQQRVQKEKEMRWVLTMHLPSSFAV